MAQHRRGNGSGLQSAVFLYLMGKGHLFDDVLILDGEAGWFKRGVRQAIHVHIENPSFNRGEGLRYNLFPIHQVGL